MIQGVVRKDSSTIRATRKVKVHREKILIETSWRIVASHRFASGWLLLDVVFQYRKPHSHVDRPADKQPTPGP